MPFWVRLITATKKAALSRFLNFFVLESQRLRLLLSWC